MEEEKHRRSGDEQVPVSKLRKEDVLGIMYAFYSFLVALFSASRLVRTALAELAFVLCYRIKGEAASPSLLLACFFIIFVSFSLIELVLFVRTAAFSYMRPPKDLNIRSSMAFRAIRKKWTEDVTKTMITSDIDNIKRKLKKARVKQVILTTHDVYTIEILERFTVSGEPRKVMEGARKKGAQKISECTGGVRQIKVSYVGKKRNAERPLFHLLRGFPGSMFPFTRRKLSVIRKYSSRTDHYKFIIDLE